MYLLSVDATAPELENVSAGSNLTQLWPIYKVCSQYIQYIETIIFHTFEISFSSQAEHNKKYDTDEEDKERFLIFQETVKTILAHNEKYKNGTESYFMGLNQFADLKPDEFKRHTGLLRPEGKN